jgi:hypothetical protein
VSKIIKNKENKHIKAFFAVSILPVVKYEGSRVLLITGECF